MQMGTYWSGISSLHVEEVVQSADLLIFVGPIFNDYTTTGKMLPVPSQQYFHSTDVT